MKSLPQRMVLLGGVATAAIAAPALAAQEPGQTGAPPPAAAQQRPAATNAAGTDIIVTAQRRAERAQDVPVVVTAFSNERLREMNVTKPQDIYGSVPSLVSGSQGQATRDVQSYSIRGQSTG